MIYLRVGVGGWGFRGNCVKVGSVLGDVSAVREVGSVSCHVGSGLSGIGSLFSPVGALLAAVSAV